MFEYLLLHQQHVETPFILKGIILKSSLEKYHKASYILLQ